MKRVAVFLILLFGIIPAALANSVTGTGFWSGVLHPLMGLDHMLALLSFGLLSGSIGHRAQWQLPLMALVMLVAGVGLGAVGWTFLSLEFFLGLSVLVAGLALVFSNKLSLLFAASGITVFSLFHGMAHGSELPTSVNPLVFLSGLALASTLLLATGVLVAQLVSRRAKEPVVRVAGSAVAAVGAYLTYLLFSAS